MTQLAEGDGLKLTLVSDPGRATGGTGDGWTSPAQGAGEMVMFVDGASLKDVIARLRGRQGETLSLSDTVSRLVGENIADVERELILQTLRHCGGNRSAAAVILGISVRTMRNKLRAFQSEGLAVPPAAMGIGAPARPGFAAGA